MEKFLIIDTETANGFAHPLCYDVGGVVVDATGFIYERFHWAVLEIIGNPHIMDTAYYAEKMPLYWQAVANHEIQPLPFEAVLRKLTALIDYHDIKKVGAYNWNFDQRALSSTAEYLFDNPNWCNREITPFCIMCAAADSFMQSKKYINFVNRNGLLTEKGNPSTTAETAFKYITGNLEFTEQHTGGKDAEIEAAIFANIMRRKKKTDWTPRYNVWRKVADFAATLDESGRA